jgi:hypothetical protein
MCKSDVSLTEDAIERRFDGRWGIWLSDTQRWWASRRGSLTSQQRNAGCVPYVHADTPEDLIARIQQQDELTQGGGA